MGHANQPPLIGRDEELASAAVLLRLRPPRCLLIRGPSGAGKTRLLLELVQRAEARGQEPTLVRASASAATIPFGALAPLLPPVETRAERRSDALDQATEAVVALGRGKGALFVDDAHLLDSPSAEVVRDVVAARAVTVVATIRDDAELPAPVAEMSVGEWTDGIVLRPLKRQEVGALAEAIVGGSIDGTSHRALWGASEGNPMFVHELLLGARQAGHLAVEGGVWRFTRPLLASARLTELLASRLADLSDREREVLDLLAVAGELGRSRLVGLTSGAAVDAVERGGMVDVAEVGRRRSARLAHALYGDVIRTSMRPLQRLAVHRILAEALERDGARRREDALRLGVLRLEAGGTVNPELMLDAARQAFAAHDDELALRLATAARQAGGGVAADVLAAQILQTLGHEDKVEAILGGVIARADNDRHRSLAAIQLAIARYWGSGGLADAEDALRGALERVTDPAWRDELVAEIATYHAHDGQPARALAAVEPILARGTDRSYVVAAFAAAPAFVWSGRLTEAERLCNEGVAARFGVADDEGMPDAGFFFIVRGAALQELGRLDEARQLLDMAYEVATSMRSVTGQAWMAASSSRVALLAGRIDDARRLAVEGAARFAEIGNSRMQRWCLAIRLQAAATVGDGDAVRDCRDLLAGLGGRTLPQLEGDMARAEAWAASVNGDPEAARAALVAGVADAVAGGARTMALAMCHDLARLGGARAALQALTDEVRAVEGPLAAARVAFVEAVAAENGDALDEVAAAFDELGALPYAADAAAAAAAAHQRSGRPQRAAASAAAARRWASACGGLRTPALLALGSARELTPREREVARLAVAGLANREIARRLSIAVRTVENHLQRAYDTLGVSNRSELGPLLGFDRTPE